MISVVLPVRDGEAYLEEALSSARVAGADQVIVVDDGSTDRSAEIATSFDFVRLVPRTGPGGLSGAYNDGLAVIRGGSVGFIGHDDVYEPSALTRLAAALGDAVAVFGRVRYELLGSAPPPGFRQELLDGPRDALLLETMLVRREAFDLIGAFRHGAVLDVDWIARLMECGEPVARIPELVVRKRILARSEGHRAAQEDPLHLVRVLREAIVRRRSEAGPNA